MNVAGMIAEALEVRGISKNEVIRRSKIDRSTFYQILGGRRMATPVQFLRILNILQPDTQDRARLLRQYERERVGEEKFASYERVRSFLRMLSDEDAGAKLENASEKSLSKGGAELDNVSEVSVSKACAKNGCTQGDRNSAESVSCPEIIASMIRKMLQKNGKIKFRLLLPSDLFFSLGIEKVLEQNVRSGSTVYVEQLLSDWDGRSEAETMIRSFAEYLLFLKKTPNFWMNAYMTDEVLFHPEGTPYPFYIIGDDAMVMFDHTGKKCICVQDPIQIRDFAEHFDGLICHASPVVELTQDLTGMIAKMVEMLPDVGGQNRQDTAGGTDLNSVPGHFPPLHLNIEDPALLPIFDFSDAPCIWLSTTPEQDKRYMDSCEGEVSEKHRWLAFGNFIRSLDIIEFTSKKRINRFFEGRRIAENGVNIELRAEDLPVLRSAVMDRIGRNLFLLNEEVQPLPKGWFLYLIGDGKMILGPYNDSSFLVSVQNWDFVRDLYDWFATRISTVNPES